MTITPAKLSPIVTALQSVLQAASVSPPGSTLTPAARPATLTDGAGSLWGFGTVAAGGGTQIQRTPITGVMAAVGGGVLIEVDAAGFAWVQNNTGAWFQWNGTGFVAGAGPTGTPVISPALALANSLGAIVTALQAALVQPAPPPGLHADIIALGKMVVPFGVNISGAEFGVVPGVAGTDYFFDTVSLPFFASAGMKKFRIPFRLERMFPGGPGSTTLDAGHVTWLTNMITANPGLTFVLDAHNFANYVVGGTDFIIGATGGPTFAQVAAQWLAIAQQFGPFANVEFDLMNEPGFSPNLAGVAQAVAMYNPAIAAIRGAGFTNRIWIEGIQSSGGASWMTNNATMLGQIVDSANNFGFQIHQYCDANGNNTQPVTVPTAGVTNLSAVTSWARTNGLQLMLGEFGTDSAAAALSCITKTMNFLCQNADVWQGGVTWFSAGSAWTPSYISLLANTHSVPPVANPQMTTMLPFLS